MTFVDFSYRLTRSLQPADIQTFPNYTALPETNETTCSEMAMLSSASRTLYFDIVPLLTILVTAIVLP